MTSLIQWLNKYGANRQQESVLLKHEWCNKFHTLPWAHHTLKPCTVSQCPRQDTIVQVDIVCAWVCWCGCFFLSDHEEDSRVSAASAAEQGRQSQRVALSAVSGRVQGRSPPGWCPGRQPPACCRTDALSSSGSPAVGKGFSVFRWKLWVWAMLRRFCAADPPCLGCSERPSVSL